MNKINGYIDSFASQCGWRQHGGMWSGVSVGDTIIQSSGSVSISGSRNITLQVLGGSGLLLYNQGPYEGWSVFTSNQPSVTPNANNTWPIAISGIFGLNDAYVGNNIIYINSSHNDVILFSDDRRFRLVPGRRMPLIISGAMYIPFGVSATNFVGDIGVSVHSANMGRNNFNAPADAAEAAARALGPATLMFNTGSGIINESVGSGICFIQGSQDISLPYTLDQWARLPMSGMVISDLMFAPDGNASGVFVLCPGLFRIDYHVAVRKTAGATGRTVAIRAIIRNRGSETEGGTGLGGVSTTFVPGSLAFGEIVNTVAQNATTIGAEFLTNINAGQFLGFEVADNGGGALAQPAIAMASGTYAVVQYIGPQRSGF
jgi:hypothetical protein